MSHPVAIVTGAASGIGAQVARRLAADHRVLAADLDLERARSLAAELPEAVAVGGDVAEEATAEDHVSTALAAFGRLDSVVLCAGLPGRPTPISEESPAEFDRILAVNLRGVFLGLRAALRQMRLAGQGGAIVVVASTAGVSGSELASYSAAKHGAVALTQSAALEGAAHGVRVNAVAPGSIDTPMMSALQRAHGGSASAARALRATTPLGRHQDRLGRTEEVAALVGFLLSAEASWITGAIVPVDGGVLAADPYAREVVAA